MKAYETSATVDEQGLVHVRGVPFAPGTEVAVVLSPMRQSGALVTPSDDNALAAARQRMRELFRTTHGFRNSSRIPREELHERGSLR